MEWKPGIILNPKIIHTTMNNCGYSLIAAIHFKRPDLLEELPCAIPLNPPHDLFESK
jgi:hypothetical protein